MCQVKLSPRQSVRRIGDFGRVKRLRAVLYMSLMILCAASAQIRADEVEALIKKFKPSARFEGYKRELINSAQDNKSVYVIQAIYSRFRHQMAAHRLDKMSIATLSV